MSSLPAAPVRLEPLADEGVLRGGDGRYEKFLGDLAGLYRDEAAYRAALAADAGAPVYWVETSTPEHGDGALTVGISVLEPGTIGDEFYMTRGHLHRLADRAELYYGLSGRGVMLLESLDGESRAVEIGPGTAVHVPGHWVHRSVNVGEERLATLFCYPADAGQDYEIIARAGGMRRLVVRDGDGWTTRPNPDHTGYRRD
ncbi:glucose-6-phosphate isomerase [Thermocatellispora tengchongensis]|uniref:glucose-6-phosphate isomerase n=1 Tax=Thermocatellispora tengchongensis TaxID=1073253 RepID=A0A840P2J3_9ACTN|nr:glucose-6-phosphate isomerase family protein [Thermocatellispora tengchongensis]MBB5131457.1 glucose-6-phosphate isomerase [Thermocatellispora tengchongensis]